MALMATSLGLTSPVVAQTNSSYNEAAKWANFGVGSWKLVRVYKQLLDEKGNIESISIDDTKSTLVDVTDQGYSLKVEVTVEVAGRRFAAEPRFFEKSWDGTTADQELVVTDAGERGVKITGHVYPTQVRELLVRDKDAQRQSTVFYSGEVAPYVLRMTTKATDLKGEAAHFDSLVEVMAVEMPYKVLSEIKTTSHVRISEQLHSSEQEKVTVEVQCPSVPGWVVAHTAKVLDKRQDNRVIERTTLELLDYEAFVTPQVQIQTRPLVTRRRGRFRNRRNAR